MVDQSKIGSVLTVLTDLQWIGAQVVRGLQLIDLGWTYIQFGSRLALD